MADKSYLMSGPESSNPCETSCATWLYVPKVIQRICRTSRPRGPNVMDFVQQNLKGGVARSLEAPARFPAVSPWRGSFGYIRVPCALNGNNSCWLSWHIANCRRGNSQAQAYWTFLCCEIATCAFPLQHRSISNPFVTSKRERLHDSINHHGHRENQTEKFKFR